MKKSRLGALVAVAAAGALVLAGCSIAGADPSASAKPKGGTVRIASVNDMTSLNYNTPQGNLVTNGQINYMTSGNFNYPDNHFKVIRNTDIGTYEKTSDDPLTVKYTLNKGVKWSDGEPITADDLVLGWAIASGHYDSATFDADGNVTKGTQYFAIAGSTAGIDSTDYPQVGDDNRSVTLKYAKPYVDWELVQLLAQPSHIVAKRAGLADAAALTSLLSTLPKGDVANPAPANKDLAAAAKFVNTAYDVTSFPSDKDLLVASGPWVVSAWTPGQSVELTPNPEYKGKLKPSIDKIVMRMIPDAAAQVTALQNGEIDLANPQSSADTKKSLETITGINLMTGNQVNYDHVDLNFKSPVFKEQNVREAFLLTIPRQQIVDAITKPVNPESKPLDSQLWLPNQKQYAETVKQNGSDKYAEVDIEKAKELLAGATPTVKILYNTKNPNRVDEFQAIQASAAKAGFKVTDGGDPNWSTLLPGGNYDASVFGWVSGGVGTGGLPQIFSTKGGGNYNGFTASNDPALETQTTLDPKKLDSLMMDVDKITFDNAYGLPLFQLPGIWGASKKIDGFVYFGASNGPFWNTWEWSVKTSSASK